MATNWISKFQAGGAAKVNERYWHNKRYTPDQIKKIQAALNKQSLGKLIAVDGIFGPETLAAIKLFQQLHSDILKVDGLVGDQTASALGITGLGDASLPQTRKGQNQARRPGIDTSTAQGRANKSASDYYNSPEMIQYLMNASNAAIGSPEYLNHYYNALNYVSPEIASKLRALNNEGDAYDEEASRNRDQAFNRLVGIKEFKNALASGVLNSPEALDKWMTAHNLSKEEMNELMADPNVGDAMLTAGVRADNGRVNSQQSLAKRFQQDVSNTMNAAGVVGAKTLINPASVVYGGLTYKPGTDMLNHFAFDNTELSGLAYDRDWIKEHKSVPGRAYDFVRDMAIDIAGNPWAASDILLGARNIAVGGKNVLTNAKNGMYGYGRVGMGTDGIVGSGESVIHPTTGKRVYINQGSPVQPRVINGDAGRFQNIGATGYTTPARNANNNGLLLTDTQRNQVGQLTTGIGGNTQGAYNGGKAVVRNYFDKTPYAPVNYGKLGALGVGMKYNGFGQQAVQERPTLQVPGYDTGTTYGPYIGTNRYQFKTGGKVNYQKIFK